MDAPVASSPSITVSPLWDRLSSFVPGPADAALPFAARLARENGWSAAHAGRVLAEYRRFAFLAMTAGHEVTPSDAVDQAWHLHLTYSRDYWDRFCGEVLGHPLHHGPTRGGRDEGHRFHEQYARTLAAYEAAFGEAAPDDIWPSARRRLQSDPRAVRVHHRRFLVLRWPLAAGTALALVLIGVIIGRSMA